jgi:hypothetical protein
VIPWVRVGSGFYSLFYIAWWRHTHGNSPCIGWSLRTRNLASLLLTLYFPCQCLPTLLLFPIYPVLWEFTLPPSQHNQPISFLKPSLPLLLRLDNQTSPPRYSLILYSWRNLFIFQHSLCLIVNHTTYAFTPFLSVGNSCAYPLSLEYWPGGSFSPSVEMAPSLSSLFWIPPLVCLTHCALFFLMTCTLMSPKLPPCLCTSFLPS